MAHPVRWLLKDKAAVEEGSKMALPEKWRKSAIITQPFILSTNQCGLCVWYGDGF